MALADTLGRFAMKPFSAALPPVGDTERAALEAGTVGFEGQLFAGCPDFDALSGCGPAQLSAEEQRFIENDVKELVSMLDDFAIDEAHDLPESVWAHLREHGFFGLIVPKTTDSPLFVQTSTHGRYRREAVGMLRGSTHGLLTKNL